MNEAEFLTKVREYIQEVEGIDLDEGEKSSEEKLLELVLPALKNTKDAPNELYEYVVPSRKGLVGKLKSWIEKKIVGVQKASLEKQILKQQKFNESIYEAIILLLESQRKK